MKYFPISLGNCSRDYLYIFAAFAFKFLQEWLISFSSILTTTQKNIFGIETKLQNHILITALYSNLGYIIFGFLFFYISKRYKTKKKVDNDKSISKINLIYKKRFFAKNLLKQLLIVSLLFNSQFILRKIVNFLKCYEFDLWIFNIIFILIYMKQFFVIKIYRHQKISLIFIVSTNFILLICLTFFKTHISVNDGESFINSYQYVSELLGSRGYIILICFFYIVLSNILSLGRVKSKQLMEKQYETPYRIIFFIGVIGSIAIFIILIFTSIFNCSETFAKLACYNDNHIDSIPQYFSELKDKFVNSTGIFFFEFLIVLPLYLFVSFYQFVCEMLITFQLNPNYILISDCIFYGIKQIISKINGKTETNYFIVQFIAEICALIGYIIFLEIIILNFCKLNKDVKINIIQRGVSDSKINELDLNKFVDDENDDSDDDDDINNINNTIKMEMTSINES